MPAPNEITPNQLIRLIGTSDAPAIVDLRIEQDFTDDPRLIPGAFRYSQKNLADGDVGDENHNSLSGQLRK